jgi:HTH-type transcriptional regulator/antitoxin HigA
MPTTTRKSRGLRDRYFQLVHAFPLVPIRNDKHLRHAQAVIDALLKKGRLDSGEDAYLEVLSDLVREYEDQHHPLPEPSDAALLAHLLEARGMSQSELASKTGIARSTISQILKGKRRISMSHVGPLAAALNADPAVFVRSKAH